MKRIIKGIGLSVFLLGIVFPMQSLALTSTDVRYFVQSESYSVDIRRLVSGSELIQTLSAVDISSTGADLTVSTDGRCVTFTPDITNNSFNTTVPSIDYTVTDNLSGTVTGTISLVRGNPDAPRDSCSALPEAAAGSTVTGGTDRSVTRGVALNANQNSMASMIDNLCPQLQTNAATLTATQQNLLVLCGGLIASPGAQRLAGLTAMAGEEVSAQGDNSVEIASSQKSNLAARMSALRGGAKGISVSGLTMNLNGEALPVSALANAYSGGAAGDDDMLASRWGLFLNGNVGFGDKEETTSEAGFDFDTLGLTFGVDYRYTDQFVVGIAGGYASTDTDFTNDGGNIETDGYTTSIYGLFFNEQFYMDGLLSYGMNDFDSQRHIRYTDVNGAVDETAIGETDGEQVSLALNAGYEINRGAWNIDPQLNLYYISSDIDSFSEGGANGLELAFGEQTIESMTVSLGLQAAFAISTSKGVMVPHARAHFVHEVLNDRRTVNANFVHDPFANAANNATPVVTISSDDPDRDYFNLSFGVSANFVNGITAFVDYETLLGLDDYAQNLVSFGVRSEL